LRHVRDVTSLAHLGTVEQGETERDLTLTRCYGILTPVAVVVAASAGTRVENFA